MLLALDTSTAQTGLALYDGVQLIGEFSWISNRRQTIELAPAIMDLIKRVNKNLEDVRAIGIAIGPGSFTSLRVGLALAKGLSLARHIPLIGIPSCDILAATIPVQSIPLATILQAGRGRLAIGWYHASAGGWQSDGAAVVLTIAELAAKIKSPTLICGELTAEERQRLERKYKNVIISSPINSTRRPGVLAELAWQRFLAGDFDPAASLAPVYLHLAGTPPI